MRILLIRALAPICALASLSGCARGPTLPEATSRLEHDAHGILDDGAERIGAAGARPRIDYDVRRPCPGHRARRLLRGTVRLRSGPDPLVALDDATDVSIGLARARGYRLDGPPSAGRRVRTFTMTDEDAGVRLVVRLRSGRHAAMRIDASTVCLPRT